MEQQYAKHGRCNFPGIWKYWDGCVRNTGQLLDEVELRNKHLDNFGEHIHQLG